MCTYKGDEIDFVALGCPEYTINGIVNVHKLLNGRKVNPGTNFSIYANGYAIDLAEKMGLRKSLEEAGVVIRAETCMVISPIANWNFKTMMTDSGKYTIMAQLSAAPNHLRRRGRVCGGRRFRQAIEIGRWGGIMRKIMGREA